MLKKGKILSIIILIGILFSPSQFTTAGIPEFNVSNTESPTISVRVIDAYYSDLDNDTYQDDIYALVRFELSGALRYYFDYYVTLTLPSGYNFSYAFAIIATGSFDLNHYFFDHAIESGNYTLSVFVILKTEGISTDSHIYVFDPPRASTGGDPTLVVG